MIRTNNNTFQSCQVWFRSYDSEKLVIYFENVILEAVQYSTAEKGYIENI